MNKSNIIVFFLLALGISSKAQKVEFSRISFGLYCNTITLPKPNVLIDSGDNILKLNNHYGIEYGLSFQYALNEQYRLRVSYGLGQSNVSYFLDDNFVESWAKSLYIDYSKADIKEVKREFRPYINSVFYHYSNFSLNLFYTFFRRNKLTADISAGFSLLSFRPSNGISHWVLLEKENGELYALPSYSSYSFNSWRIKQNTYDIGFCFSASFNQRINNYHEFGLSVGITYVPRYLLYSDYELYTPDNYYRGSIIQSSTMFSFKISYQLNWAAISRYNKEN